MVVMLAMLLSLPAYADKLSDGLRGVVWGQPLPEKVKECKEQKDEKLPLLTEYICDEQLDDMPMVVRYAQYENIAMSVTVVVNGTHCRALNDILDAKWGKPTFYSSQGKPMWGEKKGANNYIAVFHIKVEEGICRLDLMDKIRYDMLTKETERQQKQKASGL